MSFLLLFLSPYSSCVHLLYLRFFMSVVLYLQNRGLLWPLMIAVFSTALSTIIGEKTSLCGSVNLSKNRSATIDNPYEKKIAQLSSSYLRLPLCFLWSLLAFPTTSEKRSRRAKRKGKDKWQELLRFISKLTYQMCLFLFFYFCFLPRDFISPCEVVFRIL